jgi:hypothetical protein
MRFTAACLVALAVAVVVWRPAPAGAAADGFDLVIVNGHIIDGTGSPWYSGDVGIRAGRIAAIGNLTASPRRRTIDAHGSVVAPGFIDMLGSPTSRSWWIRGCHPRSIRALRRRSPVRANRSHHSTPR